MGTAIATQFWKFGLSGPQGLIGAFPHGVMLLSRGSGLWYPWCQRVTAWSAMDLLTLPTLGREPPMRWPMPWIAGGYELFLPGGSCSQLGDFSRR